MRRYDGVIFDLDGTLVDSFLGIHLSLVQAMEAVGVPPWDLERTRRTVGHGLEHLVETAVGPAKKEQALQRFRADYKETCGERTSLLPGVRNALAAMKTSGLLLAVATNKPLAFTRLILDSLKIADHFSSVMAPDRVDRPKPHPDMILAVLEELGLEADRCLYVGDMPLDTETASRAGVDCLLVASGATPFSTLSRQVAVPVVPTFSEILLFLQTPS